MKKLLKRSALVALAGMMTVSPLAFADNTDDMDIGAEILSALTLTTVEDMDFGGIIPDSAATQIVTLTPAGTISATGDVVLPNGDHQAGQFTLVGTPSVDVGVTHPGTVTLQRVGGSSTMEVSNFTYAASVGDIVGTPASGDLEITLDGSGNADVTMGADLEVAHDQTVGTYEGEIALTAVYN